MSYSSFTSDKVCEFCQDPFTTKNSRDRYCPMCIAHMIDIKRVLGDKSPSLASPEEKQRIYERVQVGRTTRHGPFHYKKV